jgi:hypothetical protein
MAAGPGEQEELLAAAWLTSLRSPRTRRAYAGDLRGWLGWLTARGTDVLDAGRVHVDLWVAGQQDQGAEPSSVRRLSALSSFYRYCAAHDLAGRVPIVGVARPVVDPDYTATIGLDRDQARALVAAADADRGPQALRTAAVIRLLLHSAGCPAGAQTAGRRPGPLAGRAGVHLLGLPGRDVSTRISACGSIRCWPAPPWPAGSRRRGWTGRPARAPVPAITPR